MNRNCIIDNLFVICLPCDIKHIIYNNIRHFSDKVNFSTKFSGALNISIRSGTYSSQNSVSLSSPEKTQSPAGIDCYRTEQQLA